MCISVSACHRKQARLVSSRFSYRPLLECKYSAENPRVESASWTNSLVKCTRAQTKDSFDRSKKQLTVLIGLGDATMKTQGILRHAICKGDGSDSHVRWSCELLVLLCFCLDVRVWHSDASLSSFSLALPFPAFLKAANLISFIHSFIHSFLSFFTVRHSFRKTSKPPAVFHSETNNACQHFVLSWGGWVGGEVRGRLIVSFLAVMYTLLAFCPQPFKVP